jgi:hypothetical protein
METISVIANGWFNAFQADSENFPMLLPAFGRISATLAG